MMPPFAAFAMAASAENAGCFTIWMWARSQGSLLLLFTGLILIFGFAWQLTLIVSDHARRTYAAYGGICIAASHFWLWLVEGVRRDHWDLVGARLRVLGAAINIFAPRSV